MVENFLLPTTCETYIVTNDNKAHLDIFIKNELTNEQQLNPIFQKFKTFFETEKPKLSSLTISLKNNCAAGKKCVIAIFEDFSVIGLHSLEIPFKPTLDLKY